jgi:hypothetical protein
MGPVAAERAPLDQKDNILREEAPWGWKRRFPEGFC